MVVGLGTEQQHTPARHSPLLPCPITQLGFHFTLTTAYVIDGAAGSVLRTLFRLEAVTRPIRNLNQSELFDWYAVMLFTLVRCSSLHVSVQYITSVLFKCGDI